MQKITVIDDDTTDKTIPVKTRKLPTALVIAAVASVTIASLVQEQQYNHAPQPYKFGYDIKDKHGEQYRHEEGDGGNAVRGSYGFTDERGIKRHVDYVADHAGFRAQVKTNEPGTANQNPAAVLMISEAPYSLGLNVGGLRYDNGGYNGLSANLGNGNRGYENTGNGYGNLGYETLGNGNLGYNNLGNQNLGNLNLGNQNLGNLNLGYGNLGLGNLGYGNLGLGNLGNGYLKSGNLGYTVGAPGYEYSLGYNGYGLGGYGLGLGMLGGLGYGRYGY